jgi:hypothetical protein
MTESIEERPATKGDQWRECIAEQERSGLSVKQFCKERGVTECSFYAWRKRLRKSEAVRFALVERAMLHECGTEACLELVLAGGERLRISAGIDGTTLRTVLDVLRA